jgi:superfamily II RNA helicase
MEYRGFTLDKFQEDAVRELEAGNSIVVSAPTGSGKTLIADYLIEMDVKRGLSIIYTAPIKALSNQKYKEFTELFGKDKVGLLTGDITINQTAPILIMTTEIFRNMAITNDSSLDKVSYVVFDEIHYINDIERGHIWEESIIFAPEKMRFCCLSATIPNAVEFAEWIKSIKNHPVNVIHHDVRYVPLHKSFYTHDLGITGLKEIKEIKDIPISRGRRRKGQKRKPIDPPNHLDLVREIQDKTPILFFCFSRMLCQRYGEELAKKQFFKHNPEITKFVREKLDDASPEIGRLQSAKILRRILPYGIAFHHAGLIPQIKEIVEDLFGMGLIKVLYATETFAVGINMPAKTVCFDALRKYDGFNFRILNSKEYFQMAGRAGRRGIDKEGFVYSMIHIPTFEYERIRAITTKDIEPLKSQFRLEVNAVLNMEMQFNKKEIDTILTYSFFSFQNKKGTAVIKRTYNNILKMLKRLDYITDDFNLTWKGKFAASVFCDEIQLAEMFATGFYKEFSDYQTLLFIASLVYEHQGEDQVLQAVPEQGGIRAPE